MIDFGGNVGLPLVDESVLPAQVRLGGAEDRKLYATALAFERVLVQQLLEAMTRASESVASDGEEGQGAAQSASLSREMLSSALADGIAAGGGLGLAPDLFEALRRDRSR